MATIYNTDSTGKLVVTNNAIPSGNTIANTNLEVTFAEPQPIIPPSMWFKGRVFELEVYGIFGTALVVPSIRGRVKIGSVVIADTGSIANAGSLSQKQWSGTLRLTVMNVGSSGQVECQGQISMQTAAGVISLPMTNTALITIDMTVQQTLTMTVQWSAISASNTIQLRQFILKA